MDNRDKRKLQKKIGRLVRRGVFRGKRIVIFGAAAASKEVKACLCRQGLLVDAVIDNDTRKIGRECMGHTVRRPDELLRPYDDSRVILVCSAGFYREITYQLAKLGYRENRRVFCVNMRTSERLAAVAGQYLLAASGRRAYKRLMRNRAEDSTVFIAPYTGTGDVYLAGLHFFEYLRRHGITDYVFVVVSGACRKVAQMFGIQNIVVMPGYKADSIIHCERVLRAGWPLVILNDCWAAEYTNPLQWIRGYKGLSFDKVFRYFVFGFEDDVPYRLPPPADDAAQIDRLLEKHGLKAGKTVVLSPYSNTLFEPPAELWRAIVADCRRKGYTVCTNCAGDEQPVEGTAAVFFPLGQAIAFMDRAGCFIGVRSGLCDVISSSSCKKIILYEKDGFFYKCSPFDYFSLKKMGLCADATELEYRESLKDEIIAAILAAI